MPFAKCKYYYKPYLIEGCCELFAKYDGRIAIRATDRWVGDNEVDRLEANVEELQMLRGPEQGALGDPGILDDELMEGLVLFLGGSHDACDVEERVVFGSTQR